MLAICMAPTALALTGFESAARPAAIGGVYCGSALSGGRLVEVRTKLSERNGLLVGTYEFADQGETTPGELQENLTQGGNSRTLIWRDKYGTGLATFDFDETGDSFAGRWGVNLQAPHLPWDGKRCETPIV